MTRRLLELARPTGRDAELGGKAAVGPAVRAERPCDEDKPAPLVDLLEQVFRQVRQVLFVRGISQEPQPVPVINSQARVTSGGK